MKLYLNRKWRSGPFGGGNNVVKAWFQRCEALMKTGSWKHELCYPGDPKAVPDVMLISGIEQDGLGMSLEQALMYKLTLNADTKVVLRLNDNDARKATHNLDAKLVKISEYLDGTIFVSEWLRDYFMSQGWKCENNTVIVNGVDREIFKPNSEKKNEKTSIMSFHWSNNRLKGEDITEWIDNEFLKRHGDEFSFTFIGRTNARLNRTKLIHPLHGKSLGEELAKHDVHISASRHDPGPNHVIEAIACGLPTYVHKDGGGCVEFAGKDHVYSSFEKLEGILLSKQYAQNVDTFTPWDVCIDRFVEFMENV